MVPGSTSVILPSVSMICSAIQKSFVGLQRQGEAPASERPASVKIFERTLPAFAAAAAFLTTTATTAVAAFLAATATAAAIATAATTTVAAAATTAAAAAITATATAATITS